MITVTVQNNTSSIRKLCQELQLLPGANEVPNEVWDRLSSVEYVRALLRKGILRVLAPPAGPVEFKAGVPPHSLSGLKKSDVMSAISECHSAEQLADWLKTDGRAWVREALVRRRYEIEPKSDDAAPSDTEETVRVL